jgi:hypothetical protein
MSSNRNHRNPQQLRALIQNMGRSIDEARNRRLGPSTSQRSDPSPEPGARLAPPRNPQAQPPAQNPQAASGPAPSEQKHHGAPPVRAANEMFEDGTPRLKARPKRAS